MKTVFPSAQVAHIWASESQDHGRNSQGNFYFTGGTIFSYRDSWPLIVLTPFKAANGKRIAIENGESYGVTTSRHLRHAQSGITGLPFHVISIPHNFGSYVARNLQEGDARDLSELAVHCANHARAEFSVALRKRDDWRAACRLDECQKAWQNALDLIALIPGAAARRKARKAIGTLPDVAFTGAWDRNGIDPHYYQRPRADLLDILADARRDQAKREAADKFKRAVSNARGFWKEANSPRNSAEIRRIRAKSAVSELKSAAIFARRLGRKLPRGLVSVASVERYRARLEPLEIAERYDVNRKRVAEARAQVRANYYSSVRALRRGTSRDPSLLRRTLSDVHNHRSVVKLCAECERVTNRAHPDAFSPDGSAHPSARVREAWRAIMAECSDTLQEFAPMAARVERMGNRDAIERAQAEANDCFLALPANDPSVAPESALARFARLAEQAETMRAQLPELAQGIHARYSAADIAKIRRAHAIATYGNRRAAFEAAMARAVAMANQARAYDATRAYSAVNDAESARTALQNARDVADIMEKLRADGDILQDHATRALLATLPSVAANVDAATVHAASLESNAVAAWRARDPRAPLPSGTYFRLTSDGAEIESSRGARVTVAAGERLWRMIRAVVARGASQSWPYGSGPRIGAFQAQAIHADGSAVIGCHSITASEARAFAEFMRWPPFDN